MRYGLVRRFGRVASESVRTRGTYSIKRKANGRRGRRQEYESVRDPELYEQTCNGMDADTRTP